MRRLWVPRTRELPLWMRKSAEESEEPAERSRVALGSILIVPLLPVMPLEKASVPPTARMVPWLTGWTLTLPKPKREALALLRKDGAASAPPPSSNGPLLVKAPGAVKDLPARKWTSPLLTASALVKRVKEAAGPM